MLTETYRNLVYANVNSFDLTIAPSHQGLYMPLPPASAGYTRYLDPANGHVLVVTEADTYCHGLYTVSSNCDQGDAEELGAELFAAGYARHGAPWFRDPHACADDPDDVSEDSVQCYNDSTDWSAVLGNFDDYSEYDGYWANLPFGLSDLRNYTLSFIDRLKLFSRNQYHSSLPPQADETDLFFPAWEATTAQFRNRSFRHVWPMRLNMAPHWYHRRNCSYDASTTMRQAAGLPEYPSRNLLGQSVRRLQQLNNATVSSRALPIFATGAYVIDHVKRDDGSAVIFTAGQPTNCGNAGWICFGDNSPADYDQALENYFEGTSNWDLTSPLHLLTPWLVKAAFLYQETIASLWPGDSVPVNLFEGSCSAMATDASVFARAAISTLGSDFNGRKELTQGIAPIAQRLPAGSRLDDAHGIVYVTADHSPAAFLELRAAGFASTTHVPEQASDTLTLIALPVREQVVPGLHPTALLVTGPDALGRSWAFLPPSQASYGATLLGQLP